ncbi:MAG: N-6 DNA methylase [Fulvivirga sp.]
MKHLQNIFDKLNLTKEKGLFILEENLWKGFFTNRVERLLEKIIRPDAFFCIDNKPFILFFENPENKSQKLKEIWNFNESPIIFIISEDSLEIYNGFEFLEDKDTLQLFGNQEILDDFTYFKLVTGETWEKYQNSFSYQNRVDYHLLHNIKAARDLLISGKNSLPITNETANSLLGKVIFVRYLIDRKVKLDFEQTGSRKWADQEFCSLLLDRKKVISFFTYLKEKFNGNLFHLTDDELNSIPQESFLTIIDLLSGNEISSGQISLFNLYDFSIIPVEFISNVYELFIGKDQQESKGAYYTPLFLVDYILSQTVEKKFLKHKSNYSCRVLDPSCGSGIFLVETLRKIIEQFRANHPDLKTNTNEYKDALKKLATQNLFGVDKDRSAVDVAIFSIYLTLLDYQSPSDIETFKFPLLFGKNFFSYDFFDEEAEFNNVFKNMEFDFIVGNPPWKRGKGKIANPLFVQYVKNRSNREKTDDRIPIKISNSEIAQAFVLRVSDFCSQNTKVALIATSKILYNLNGKRFRKYLLDRFLINKVFELAPVRKEVFDKSNDKAVGPAVVLFYEFAHKKNTDNNIIEHITLKPNRFFSLFKVFTIQRDDYKKVVQSQLKEFDYLWKVLVYGSYLDFNLIDRLKKSFLSIKKIVSDEEKFLIGQGAMIGGGDKNDASHLIGKPFLDTKKDIKAFWVNNKPSILWNFESVHRPRNPLLYELPVLLITGGLNKFLRSVSAVHNGGSVFKSSLTGIASNEINTLKSISGILNSSFFSYFSLQTFSSTGIEREESHDEEKFNVPYTDDSKICDLVSNLMKLKQKELGFDNFMESMPMNLFNEKLKELDLAIAKSFDISEQEMHLMEYANDIIIPIIMKHKGHENTFKPLKFQSRPIQDYIDLFLESFNDVYKKVDQRLIVKVRHTNQIIGLFFKVVSSNNAEPITWMKANNDDIIQLLSSIGTEKITDRLFVQKDIRGFEKDGFYIIKPNEQRLWHKAIAHLDINEFVDSVLVAGKKSVMDVQ